MNYSIKDTTLIAIGDAIREKAETTTKYSPEEMAKAIKELKLAFEGEGVVIPDEMLNITGNTEYMFHRGQYDWLLEQCKDKMTTEGLVTCKSMFTDSTVEELPFDFNFNTGSWVTANVDGMFVNCQNLKSIGDINNLKPKTMNSMFSNCRSLEYLPTFNNLTTYDKDYGSTEDFTAIFAWCQSLKEIPEELLSKLQNTTSYGKSIYNAGFRNCNSLTKLNNLPVYTGDYTNIEVNENMFVNTFEGCYNLSEVTFEQNTRSGTARPYEVCWGNQHIQLFPRDTSSIIVSFPNGVENCVFNVNSAIKLIDSLPDTIPAWNYEFIGTNMISFFGNQGLNTGGAISTLTEEQIAKAVGKGWTIALL